MMKHHHHLTTGLCGLVLLSGVATAAKIKPRQTRDRAPEAIIELTAAGTKLEAGYAAMLNLLREEIKKELPVIDGSKQAALIEALKAEAAPAKDLAGKEKSLRICRGREGGLQTLREKLKIAPSRLAEARAKLEWALALPDGQEDKTSIVESCQQDVATRQADLEKLPGEVEKANQALEKARMEEPELQKQVAAAMRADEQAKANSRKALDALGVGDLLASDKLDGKLARVVILAAATPRYLAQFAQQGPEKEKLIGQLFSDTPLMLQMLVADGPFWDKYGEAMAIYQAIQKASPNAKEGLFQRLAVAVSLSHAVPLAVRESGGIEKASDYIDPVKRYLSYEKAHLDGKLDPAFKDHSVWNLTMVVDGKDPDEIFAWGREMLRSYRPDLITLDYADERYVKVVDADIDYTSKNVRNDRPELQNMQNILANGGICGRRAFFGRFMLRAFGIPTIARKEPGHATLAHWGPAGWYARLGGPWGGRATISRYGRDMHFLVNTQAREDEREFMKVKRAQWIGDVMGEEQVFGLLAGEEPGFWYAASLIEQSRIAGNLKVKAGNVAGKDPEAAAPVEVPAAERAIAVDGAGAITIPAIATKIPEHNMAVPGWGPVKVVTCMDSHLGGMQLHYSRYGGPQVLEYTFDALKAGRYQLTSSIATSLWDMSLLVSANGSEPVNMPLPYTMGLWETSQPIGIALKAGTNTLTFTRAQDARKGVSIRDFKLAPAK